MSLLYEKFLSIYRETNMQNFYPSYLLENLDRFARETIYYNKAYLSPYRFAHKNMMTARDAVQFFLFFTNADGPFDIIYFFECSNVACDHRFKYTREQFKRISTETVYEIYCEECGKKYIFNDILPFIQVYFILKPEQCLEFSNKSKIDPSSTFGALKDMTNGLQESPPSFLTDSKDGGEGGREKLAVQVVDVVVANIDNSGNIISIDVENSLPPFLQKMRLSMNERIRNTI
ncbi:hypothetical protein FE783_12565 [Paenibacillus mesophilus]|uniref:hypothetical protein n=1 Tax=Paenibacillus mesophilus TaxID=2582849 RepID=UPI00110F4846|nr:hypothetical protein [Paenibacillus mesophilus]TMV49342.1 hypothetical protein FE783_12565 [Paenibacillus mesophilus]